jgi:hypothetical protein
MDSFNHKDDIRQEKALNIYLELPSFTQIDEMA